VHIIVLFIFALGHWQFVNKNSFIFYSDSVETISLLQYCVCVLKQWLHHSLTPMWC